MSKRWRGGLIVFLLIILSGCSVLQKLAREPVFDTESTCIQLFDTLDRAVDEAGTRDAQATRIAGFPFLRINRFLTSFRDEIKDEGSFNFWVDQLHALDMEARQYEIRNTPLELFDYEYGGSNDSSSLLDRIRDCGSKLRLSMNVNNRQIVVDHLLKRAIVPDVYSSLKRFFGIYPLSSMFVLRGIEDLQRATYERFQQPLYALPVKGRLIRYAPQESADAINDEDIKHILRESSNNPLGIPILSIKTQKRLFDKYAPVWEVDVVTDNDHIGTPYWETETRLAIDTKKPHVFRHLSYTRLDGNVLLQLNYVIWFPARPRSGYFDLLGGHIDGITWRVTLGSDGYPVFYDSMHNCGCYHLFFPTNHFIPRVLTDNHEKPLLLPVLTPKLSSEDTVVIRVANGTHYLQRVNVTGTTGSSIRYTLTNYNELRSIALPSGHKRSMFGPDGLVTGTERKERWVLWPMGIPAPGSMRQWGHHATAFVGKRHFDDPDLLDRYFKRIER